jgi:hypothetical protein
MAYDPAELPEDMSSPQERTVGPAHKAASADTPQTQKSNAASTTKTSSTKKDNTLQFPSKRESKNTKDTTSTSSAAKTKDELTSLIRQMLSTNGLLFPKAHQKWIEKELEKNPKKDRLEEIIRHMQSVINEEGEPEQKPEPSNEPQVATPPKKEAPAESTSQEEELIF